MKIAIASEHAGYDLKEKMVIYIRQDYQELDLTGIYNQL